MASQQLLNFTSPILDRAVKNGRKKVSRAPSENPRRVAVGLMRVGGRGGVRQPLGGPAAGDCKGDAA